MLALDVEAVDHVYFGAGLDFTVLEDAVEQVYLVAKLFLVVYCRHHCEVLVLLPRRCSSW